ncbi:MAG: Xaa-Pro peptidase family protein [Synergistales bacterium]|nr:Xaa-Pro peptidase family protein [Synergistales bacterium]
MVDGPIEERIAAARKALVTRGLDALFLLVREGANWESVYYLSGFRGSSSALVVTGEEALLITDGRYLAQAKEQSPCTVVDQGNRRLLAVVQGELLRRKSLQRIGYEAERLTCADFAQLPGEGVEWVDASDVVLELRRRKDPMELELLREAGRIAGEALAATLEDARPGMTERHFAALLEYNIVLAGAEGGWGGPSFIVASGPRGALPHGAPTERSLREGECVTVDFGARYKGYVSDITRNFCLGRIDPWAEEIHGLLREAQQRGMDAIAAGRKGSDVDQAARTFLDEAGYGPCFPHGLGHGLGLELHEGPRLSRAALGALRCNDVVTVEPGIYVEGRGGLRLEDDCVVTDQGCAVLSSSIPRELFVV